MRETLITNRKVEKMMNKLVLAMGVVIFVGTIMFVQQNATNQTNMTSNYTAQAKPDQTKFCDTFQNDDGSIGEDCQWKSKGECKKSDRAQGDEFTGCKKRDKDKEPNGGNNLSPDEDGEGSGSGPND